MNRRSFVVGSRLAVLAIAPIATILAVGSHQGSAEAQGAGPQGDFRDPRDPIDARGNHFVQRQHHRLFHRGQPFRVAGANNYYPMYVSQTMVDDLFNKAAASSFNVMRFWGFIDIGNQDGSNSVDGIHNGVYFHYWNGSAPAFNDGPTGLQHLDYVIYRAGQLGLKVVIPFVNNWNQFGGMDQYVRWAGGQFHDQFYTDPTIRGWYHDWIAHVLNHVNTYTGVAYKDDATIMSFDLANEPRCSAGGVYPQSANCTTKTLTAWADEVSTFVKTIDKRHLLSAGDEGFYCDDPNSSDFTINCSQGVDTIALASVPNMDAMSYHLYPDAWGKTPAWGTQWIARHIADSHRLGERAVLGELGLLSKATRNPVYKEWTDTILKDDGAGSLYWILSDKQDDGTPYPDFDGYTVYCPSPVCTMYTNYAKLIEQRPPFNFSPVADDDLATTANDTAVTLNLTANDITYGNVPLDINSVDLDPATAGRQQHLTTAFGSYDLQPGGSVLFTPASACVSGTVSTPYVVRDDLRRLSTPADIVTAVAGIPGELYSFEDGTDSWSAASFNATAGTTAQSPIGATSCNESLQVTVPPNAGGWFGPSDISDPPLPLPLAGVSQILLDISAATAGTSQSVAVQVGNDFHWCQTDFGFQNGGTSSTVTVDLASLLSSTSACEGSLPADTSALRAIWVFFNDGGSGNGGVYYLDNVRTTP
jgi:mannan endo-1,4-beta-mannosidase